MYIIIGAGKQLPNGLEVLVAIGAEFRNIFEFTTRFWRLQQERDRELVMIVMPGLQVARPQISQIQREEGIADVPDLRGRGFHTTPQLFEPPRRRLTDGRDGGVDGCRAAQVGRPGDAQRADFRPVGETSPLLTGVRQRERVARVQLC